MFDKITNIDAEIEKQRSIEYCGKYSKRKRQKAKSNIYVDPCAEKPCYAECTFDNFITCKDNGLHEDT